MTEKHDAIDALAASSEEAKAADREWTAYEAYVAVRPYLSDEPPHWVRLTGISMVMVTLVALAWIFFR